MLRATPELFGPVRKSKTIDAQAEAEAAAAIEADRRAEILKQQKDVAPVAVLDANNERRTAEVKAEVKGIWRNALDAERPQKKLEWQRE